MTSCLRAFLPLCLLLATACVETRLRGYGQRPVPPDPRPPANAPPDARADALVITVGASPLDTNGNGYPDLIEASAYLFDRRYAPPLREDGAFEFALFAAGEVDVDGAAPIKTWRISGEALQERFTRSGFGAGYRFRLSLLEGGGTDRLDLPVADLVSRFDPAGDRSPVYASETSAIQLGRRVRVPTVRWPEEPDDPAEEIDVEIEPEG